MPSEKKVYQKAEEVVLSSGKEVSTLKADKVGLVQEVERMGRGKGALTKS